jgi:hypothetical protein
LVFKKEFPFLYFKVKKSFSPTIPDVMGVKRHPVLGSIMIEGPEADEDFDLNEGFRHELEHVVQRLIYEIIEPDYFELNFANDYFALYASLYCDDINNPEKLKDINPEMEDFNINKTNFESELLKLHLQALYQLLFYQIKREVGAYLAQGMTLERCHNHLISQSASLVPFYFQTFVNFLNKHKELEFNPDGFTYGEDSFEAKNTKKIKEIYEKTLKQVTTKENFEFQIKEIVKFLINRLTLFEEKGRNSEWMATWLRTNDCFDKNHCRSVSEEINVGSTHFSEDDFPHIMRLLFQV